MTLLATSTPAHRNPVRVLFYGQSITKQEWSQAVAQDLRTRYPSAELTIENRAIGGYSSPFLIQTVAHDVYGFYPDLIIFHDFGDQQIYEKIIAGIRSHTTAEILIQTDYPTWMHVDGEPDTPASVKREEFHQRHSFEWLPDLCRRYACEVIDVRRPWIQYLNDNRLKAGDLLADGVHLNARGNNLLAEITKPYLRYDPSLPQPDLTKNYQIGRDAEWKKGRLKIEFEGNRVDLIAGSNGPHHAAEADVWIDGKRPSENPDLYFITRPTDTYSVDWPAINRVTAKKPLLVEDWTLRLLEEDEVDSRWRFEVEGSKTGPDGTGLGTQPFVSKSGRVAIDPDVWGVKRAYDLRHQQTPIGFEVHWSVIPMFIDTYRAPRIADPSKEYAITAAQGLSNGRHTLELVARDKTNPPINWIRVYRPPIK